MQKYMNYLSKHKHKNRTYFNLEIHVIFSATSNYESMHNLLPKYVYASHRMLEVDLTPTFLHDLKVSVCSQLNFGQMRIFRPNF